jgi:hypothetical protein
MTLPPFQPQHPQHPTPSARSTTAYLSIHNMVAWMMDAYGTQQQRKHYGPALASMEVG